MKSIAEIMDALPEDWPYARLLPRRDATGKVKHPPPTEAPTTREEA